MSAMQLSWGSYTFGAGACGVTNRTIAVMSTWTKQPVKYETEFHVKAYLDATEGGTAAQDQLSTLENELYQALSTPYQNFILKCSDGTASSMTLLNSDTLTGLRCKDFSTNEVTGGEFATMRTVEFTIVADYAIATGNPIMSYKEVVTITGTGGPRRVWRFPVNNVPGIRQVVTPYSLITMTQVGEAVGFRFRPIPPPPLLPLFEVYEARVIGQPNAEWQGQAYINFGVSWSYKFERGDGGTLTGQPIIPKNFNVLVQPFDTSGLGGGNYG